MCSTFAKRSSFIPLIYAFLIPYQEQLYALSLENQKLMEANEELDRQIIQARHLRTLDSMLETQVRCLVSCTVETNTLPLAGG